MRSWQSSLKVEGWSSQYQSVSNYLGHYRRKLGSEKTKDYVCGVLASFCKFAQKDPDYLVRLSRQDASRLLQDFVDSLAQKGNSIRTVNVTLAFLKVFFRVNGFKGEKEVEVERYHQPARYRKRPEYVPTAEEIYKMAYSAGSARNRALILALYTSGLRNSTLRAVLYQDVKTELGELDLVKMPVYPEMKHVDAGACKGNISYYSFVSKQAVHALRGYLDERKTKYGSLEDGEPLFASTSTNVPIPTRKRTPVKRRSLDEVVKKSARRAGLTRWNDVYPHCLRKAFESALRNSGMDIKDQEFLMGHILPRTQDTYYDKTKVDDLRRKYARVNFFPERGATEDSRKRQILDTAKLLGFSDDRIKKVEEALAKYKEVDEAIEEIKKLSLSSERESEKNSDNRSHNSFRIVKGEDKLIKSLSDGWDLIKEISEDKFILKRSFD